MGYLGVQDRFQIQMSSMEEFIDKENTVRFVDAFVEQLELDKLCFHTENTKRVEKPNVFEIKKAFSTQKPLLENDFSIQNLNPFFESP